MPDPVPCYTMDDLTERFGISRHLVYHYRKVGLLSPPRRRPGAPITSPYVWTRQHLEELRQVREIREQNRTLADIRDYLHPEEVEA